MEDHFGRLTVEAPLTCVIRVGGALPARWADDLGGLRLTAAGDPGDAAGAATGLRGELPDQAALLGVLTTLYDQGYPLLALACAPAGRTGALPDPTPAEVPAAEADTDR